MWIARDKMGPLCLYNTKPTQNEEGNWYVAEDTWCGDNPAWEYLQILSKDDCFSNLKWNDEPIEVELVSKYTEPIDEEKLFDMINKEYESEYSTGEYCHKQSFSWGFQEGFRKAMEGNKL